MALYVNTNVSSLNSQRKLTNATNSLNSTYQHLASGMRINSAKDDAAGLQISNRLTSQINGLNQGNRNCNDAIALAQTMEGALDETTSMLQRIRTLAIQAANGTNTDIDRKSIQDEVTQLSTEINRIACKTTYAGQQCLAGAAKGMLDAKGNVTFQVGAYSMDTLTVTMSTGFTISGICLNKATGLDGFIKKGNYNKDELAKSGIYVSVATTTKALRFSVSTADFAQGTIAGIDKLINIVDTKRAELGAMQNRMESTIRNQSNVSENVSDARSRIRDADYAEETANLTAQTILQQASTSILTQANQRPQIAMTLLGGGQ